MHNAKCTCWNCPAINLAGKVDFRACGQSIKQFDKTADATEETHIMAECKRRPELGLFNPMDITFEECPQWRKSPYGYMLKDMRVMILGIDGYLGWTLALWLGSLGFKVSGVDNYNRREWVKERGAQTIVPISRMNERLHAAREVLDLNMDFRQIDIYSERERLKEFVDEVKPESVVHYAECPSAPFSMIDVEHAIEVQKNNVLGTLAALFTMRDIVPETSMVKLGTMGEYGTPLTGRPIFEGLFPADAVLQWDDREWSLGGEIVPRDPASFYHVSKVQDTFNCYEACKYWWLRSYDVMQGVIFGVHTDQLASDPRLRTRLDIDECFGTVINRFVAQAVAGIPLTLYGLGKQIRGYIALRDAMECMTRLICSPPEPGQYAVVNQVSGIYSTRQLAYEVAKTGREEFGLPVEIQRVENPRVEADEHPFEVLHERLPKQFEFEAKVSVADEIRRMFELFLTDEVKSRIEERRQVIMPRTWWSGVKKEVERLELLELKDELHDEEQLYKVNG